MAQAAAKFTGGYDMRNSKRWNEIEAKSIRTRLNWFEKNFDRIFAQTPRDQIPSRALNLIKELRENRVPTPAAQHGHKKTPWAPLPPADLAVEMRTMKPVDPEIREILYDGISANGEGRQHYLKERYRLDPNQRYYFPEVSSFDYGWNGSEVGEILNNGPRYGKSQIIKQSFYSRNGIHPDDERNRMPYGPTILSDPL